MDVRTDPTENVWPMVKAGKGISEMLPGLRRPVSACKASWPIQRYRARRSGGFGRRLGFRPKRRT